MGNSIDILFIPIAVIAIALILKWLRDLVLISKAKYDQTVEYENRQYLFYCRDMLNRIYYQSEMEDKYHE